MAKTTKVTKTNNKSSAKATKTSNKSGKLSFLTNKINFRSRKIQFLLTILVFALVGGAWFTYKSFAAEPIQTATFGTANMLAYDGGGKYGCTGQKLVDMVQVSEEQKNNQNVWVLKNRGSCIISAYKPSASVADSYRVCVFAKGMGNIEFPSLGNSVGQAAVGVSTGYVKRCSGTVRYEANRVEPIVIRNSSGQRLQVGTVTLERMGLPSSNTVAPQPVK